MKTFAPPYGILATLFLALSFLIVTPMKSQTIQIDSTFTTYCEIFPFEYIELISELRIEGDVELNNDTSLVRVILEDESGFRYMVLEAYPLICPEIDFTFQDHCDETCALDMVNPASVIIQIIDATLDLKSFSYETEAKENAETARYTAKRELDADKIEAMNQRVADFDMNWTSGDNSIVASYYESKSAMFGEGYNLLGYDYYAGGIFEFLGHRDYPKVDPDLVRHFDWRERHGANDPESPYWDGDDWGNGWLTGPKDQGLCGSCWAFSAVGAVEAIANLYSVDSLDFDLSEQYLISCCPDAGNCIDGGYPDLALECIQTGIVSEYCIPYLHSDVDCQSVMCLEPDSVFNIHGFLAIPRNFDSIRKKLIECGPLTFNFMSDIRPHAVVLSGFKFDPKDSTLIWLYKDSKSWDTINYGFKEIKIESIYDTCYSITPPLYINIDTTFYYIDTLDQHCYDKDHDGYYFWGIGPKPDTLSSPLDEDCDDTDPFVGGYDENYYCTCLLEMDTISHIISTDTTWADTTYVNFEVIIDSGACLTISGYTAFAPEAMILVNPGGKLILDSAYLTKACPDLWDGIEVRGSDTSQFYNEYFGIVEIRDGSIIEFARCAIANHCKRCSPAVYQSGGIILAEEAIFRDNETDILLAPFHHIYQGNEVPYVASFEKCRFLTTENLYDLTVPKAHVELKDIFGLTFYACEFENLTGFSFAPPSIRGKGISSIDGQFMIRALCNDTNAIPCQNITPCEFNNLEYGIKAMNAISKHGIIIENSLFETNLVGVSLSGIDYASILSNSVKCLSSVNGIDEDRFIGGLFVEGCDGYHIENNFFFRNKYSDFTGNESLIYGIGIKNSGPETNEIYDNKFDTLYAGIISIGENRGRESGLCLKCNEMTENTNDFIVVEDENPPQGALQGIYKYQGDPNDSTSMDSPAGNTFSWQDSVANPDKIKYYNFLNNADSIFYYHHKKQLDPITYPLDSNYTHGTIVLIERNLLEYNKDTACPSQLEEENNLKVFTSPHLKIAEADEQIALLTEQLFALIDGGNTEALNFEVMTSMPDDALEIRQELLDESPYLSDTVMQQAIYKENVLPNAMIRDILAVNPQSAKSFSVMNALDTRFEPMPDYMMAQIMEGQRILGAKELLEAQIQSWQRIRSKAKADLFRQYLKDTNFVDQVDSIINFLQGENELLSKYDLATMYWNLGDTLNSILTLNTIPYLFDLTNNQLTIYQQYVDYFNILKKMADSNWVACDLDSVSVITLSELKQTGTSQISAFARGMLVKGGFINYIETIVSPQFTEPSEFYLPYPEKEVQDQKRNYITVFPNPASDYVIVYYEMPADRTDNNISLTNEMGYLLGRYSIDAGESQVVLDLRNVPNGSYFISLFGNGNLLETEKLIKIQY